MTTELGAYVEPRRAKHTFGELVEVFRWGLQDDSSASPSDEVVALVMAKSALETGRWNAIWNDNFGNMKVGRWTGNYTCIVLNEVIAKRVVWFHPRGQMSMGPSRPDWQIVGQEWPVPPGHPQTRMRAHANKYDGVSQYFALLKARFPRSYAALWSANPKEFVHALKTEGYFTADEEPYRNSVASIQREFINALHAESEKAKAATLRPLGSDIVAIRCIDIAETPIALCAAEDPYSIGEAQSA